MQLYKTILYSNEWLKNIYKIVVSFSTGSFLVQYSYTDLQIAQEKFGIDFIRIEMDKIRNRPMTTCNFNETTRFAEHKYPCSIIIFILCCV